MDCGLLAILDLIIMWFSHSSGSIGRGGGGGATILKYIKVYPRVKIGKKPTF